MTRSAKYIALCAGMALAMTANAGQKTVLRLAGQRFSVEVAKTEIAQTLGLMFRDHLAENAGMWFVFAGDGPREIWMKDMRLPLDVLYFNSKRQLVDITPNVPPCEHDPCPIYKSSAPARYILEVPAGTAARLNLALGDTVSQVRPAQAGRTMSER